MLSASTENFIKTIFKSEQVTGFGVKPGNLAANLGITNAAATDMARKLADKNLVEYKKYKPVKLTPTGKKFALNILRKHRLWETFLHKTFDMTLHEIHREAELLEHQTSDFMADKINAFLGHPETDPHGDPIPKINGFIAPDKSCVPLSKAQEGKYYRITRLFSSEKEFFDFCHANHIDIGTSLKIEKQYPKNNMTEIMVQNKILLLGADFSDIIYVKRKKTN